MNSEYAHRRPKPKKMVGVMLDEDHIKFVKSIHHSKSAWCRVAVIKAIESHPDWSKPCKTIA